MVDSICIGFFEVQEAEARITKLNIIALSGTRTHDPLIVKSLQLPLCHQA